MVVVMVVLVLAAVMVVTEVQAVVAAVTSVPLHLADQELQDKVMLDQLNLHLLLKVQVVAPEAQAYNKTAEAIQCQDQV
jgi:hypothetical protein